MEVKQTLEVRKTEVAAQVVNKVETKLTIAEQKRETELKKKLETVKKHVNIFRQFFSEKCFVSSIFI